MKKNSHHTCIICHYFWSIYRFCCNTKIRRWNKLCTK